MAPLTWQCCKCGMQNIRCARPGCDHYQCVGCPLSYTTSVESAEPDPALPIAPNASHVFAQPPMSIIPEHSNPLEGQSTSLSEPNFNGLPMLYPNQPIAGQVNTYTAGSSFANAFGGNPQSLNPYTQAQHQPAATSFQSSIPAMYTGLGSNLMAQTAPLRGNQGLGGYTNPGPAQNVYNPSRYTPFLGPVQQTPAGAVRGDENFRPLGSATNVVVPPQVGTAKLGQQPSMTNLGFTPAPPAPTSSGQAGLGGFLGPFGAQTQTTPSQLAVTRPISTRPSVRTHPYLRGNQTVGATRQNSLAIRTAAPLNRATPVQRRSAFTHPAHRMVILNSGVDEEQIFRNQNEYLLSIRQQVPAIVQSQEQNQGEAYGDEMARTQAQMMPFVQQEVGGFLPVQPTDSQSIETQPVPGGNTFADGQWLSNNQQLPVMQSPGDFLDIVTAQPNLSYGEAMNALGTSGTGVDGGARMGMLTAAEVPTVETSVETQEEEQDPSRWEGRRVWVWEGDDYEPEDSSDEEGGPRKEEVAVQAGVQGYEMREGVAVNDNLAQDDHEEDENDEEEEDEGVNKGLYVDQEQGGGMDYSQPDPTGGFSFSSSRFNPF